MSPFNGPVLFRDLNAEDYPYTIWTVGRESREPLWGVTLLRPPRGVRFPLKVPPVKSWVGEPVDTICLDGRGHTTVVPG